MYRGVQKKRPCQRGSAGKDARGNQQRVDIHIKSIGPFESLGHANISPIPGITCIRG